MSGMVHGGIEYKSDKGAVSAGNRYAVEAGLEILENGGNAIDAAVAAAFTSFVAEPNNGGIGGYGHLSAYLVDGAGFLTVDHNPRAPLAATDDMYALSDPTDEGQWPEVVDDDNGLGHRGVATPSAVAGLWHGHREGGSLPWSDLIQPAIRLADAGLEVTWNLVVEINNRLSEIRSMPGSAGWLLRDGDLPTAKSLEHDGDRLDCSALAGTLREIADRGLAGFTEGRVAETIEAEMKAGGGLITAEDLSEYAPKVFYGDTSTFRGLEYITCHDTVSYEVLNILDSLDPGGPPGTPGYFNVMAEASARAFSDNLAHYGDPDFGSTPERGLASREFAAERARGIGPDSEVARPLSPGDPWPYSEGDAPESLAGPSSGGMDGTTMVVTADSEGNMVALITTIGNDFGSLTYLPELGVVLNDGMKNFDPRPGRANSIAPGKMPLFGVPALVAAADGKGVMAVAGSGGYAILSGVIHTVVNLVDHGLGVQAAIDQPRTHSLGKETCLDARVDPAVAERLKTLGHSVEIQELTPGVLPFGRVSAITRDPETGILHAGSGPSWFAGAGGL